MIATARTIIPTPTASCQTGRRFVAFCSAFMTAEASPFSPALGAIGLLPLVEAGVLLPRLVIASSFRFPMFADSIGTTLPFSYEPSTSTCLTGVELGVASLRVREIQPALGDFSRTFFGIRFGLRNSSDVGGR